MADEERPMPCKNDNLMLETWSLLTFNINDCNRTFEGWSEKLTLNPELVSINDLSTEYWLFPQEHLGNPMECWFVGSQIDQSFQEQEELGIQDLLAVIQARLSTFYRYCKVLLIRTELGLLILVRCARSILQHSQRILYSQFLLLQNDPSQDPQPSAFLENCDSTV